MKRLFEVFYHINPTQTLITILFSLIAAYIWKIWTSYRFFDNLSIPTPPYQFFFGNFLQLRKNKKYSDVIREWTQKYGKLYGYYEGHLPVLVTSDLDFIQEIFIKQYSNFSARKKSPLDRGENDHRVGLFNASKNRWKKMRTILNPSFSSSKLRKLNLLMSKCADRLIDKLSDNVDIEINVSNYFKRFTMDTIWNCAFGLDIDLQNDPNNPYLEKSESVFRNMINFTKPMYLGIYFAEFKKFILNCVILYNYCMMKLMNKDFQNPFIWLTQKVMEILEYRQRADSIKRQDLVQLLLEAKADDIDEFKIEEPELKTDLTHKHIEKKLTIEEIQRNLVTFMLAGYETTSTALTYIFYVLATMPHEQEKVRNEIDAYFLSQNVEINFDSVQTLSYLDMFIKEVLRMYPIGASVVTRRCMYPTSVKGLKFPKDLAIVIDVLSVHYDRELWGPTDPNVFYPERFLPECKRNPLAYMAFGVGPRICIGMRFALIEIKIALVKILKMFEVIACSRTAEKLDFIEGIVRSPKQDIIVQFKRR